MRKGAKCMGRLSATEESHSVLSSLSTLHFSKNLIRLWDYMHHTTKLSVMTLFWKELFLEKGKKTNLKLISCSKLKILTRHQPNAI